MADTFTTHVIETRVKYWDKFGFTVRDLNEHLRPNLNGFWVNSKDKAAISQVLELLDQADRIMTARYCEVLGERLVSMTEQNCPAKETN